MRVQARTVMLGCSGVRIAHPFALTDQDSESSRLDDRRWRDSLRGTDQE